jgi:hypothetical protein
LFCLTSGIVAMVTVILPIGHKKIVEFETEQALQFKDNRFSNNLRREKVAGHGIVLSKVQSGEWICC